MKKKRTNANGNLAREERLQIMLAPEELKALDDFRFVAGFFDKRLGFNRAGFSQVAVAPPQQKKTHHRAGGEDSGAFKNIGQ